MKKNNRKARIRSTAVLLSIVTGVSLLSGCQAKKKESVNKQVKVETRSVERGMLEITTDYIGNLSPNITVDVVPFVSGTVEKVNVKVGDRVKAGTLLCQLDDTSADLSVQSAEDAVNSAQAGKDAAENQTKSAKIQADSSVKTLKNTLKSYKKALKTAKEQKEKLKKSRKSLKSAQSKAGEAYTASKKRYKMAENLYIQYETFLNENPDCKTTGGLTAAASVVPVDPSAYDVPTVDPTVPSVPAEGNTGTGDAGTDQGTSGTDTSGTGAPAADADTASSQTDNTTSDSENDAAKQAQAAALLQALTKLGLTVEYLSTTGLNSLKENVSDGENAYTSAQTGLAQLDSTIATLNTNISQLKSQISATEDSLDQAKKMADLASAGSDVYDAQIEAAKTGVEAAKYQKDMYRLTAPIDGVVDAVNVTKDNTAPQGMAAFTISEKESMSAAFFVTEEVARFLKIGDPVDVITDETEEGKGQAVGHITMIGTTADPQKGLFKVEAEILSVGQIHLAGGTTVKLTLVSNAVDQQLLIPYDSVYYDDGQAYVYRIIDNKAVRTDITTGLFNQDEIVVTEGLNQGDSVVTTWASGLKDGAEVEIIP